MLIKEENQLLFPLVKAYRLLAIDIDNDVFEGIHLLTKRLLNPLGKVVLDEPTKRQITTYTERLKKLNESWEFYLIPELTQPYPISAVLRLNRQKNHRLNPMNISKLHNFFSDKGQHGKGTQGKESLINITKFFNLVREHLDFATRIISARNDELANYLSMSQRALAGTLTCLKISNLITIEDKRRHQGTQLPNIIKFSPEFIKLAFNITDSELEERTSEALSEINSKQTKNRSFSEVPLTLALNAIEGQNKRIIESIEAHSDNLSTLMEDELDAAFSEATPEQIQKERIQQLEVDLKGFSRNIGQIKNSLNQSPYIICFENTKYTTVDEAVSGFKSLERDMIEKKEYAKKMYLSGNIKDLQALNSLSYLL